MNMTTSILRTPRPRLAGHSSPRRVSFDEGIDWNDESEKFGRRLRWQSMSKLRQYCNLENIYNDYPEKVHELAVLVILNDPGYGKMMVFLANSDQNFRRALFYLFIHLGMVHDPRLLNVKNILEINKETMQFFMNQLHEMPPLQPTEEISRLFLPFFIQYFGKERALKSTWKEAIEKARFPVQTLACSWGFDRTIDVPNLYGGQSCDVHCDKKCFDAIDEAIMEIDFDDDESEQQMSFGPSDDSSEDEQDEVEYLGCVHFSDVDAPSFAKNQSTHVQSPENELDDVLPEFDSKIEFFSGQDMDYVLDECILMDDEIESRNDVEVDRSEFDIDFGDVTLDVEAMLEEWMQMDDGVVSC